MGSRTLRSARSLGPVLCVATLLLLFSGCEDLQDKTVLRLGHGMAPSHPVSKGMRHLAEQVDSLSNGEMEVQIYPSEQLGTERQCLELLQLGSLDMTKVSSAVLEGFTHEYRVFGLPYIFRNEAHRWEVLQGDIGKEILLSTEDIWLRGLTYYDAGSRSFYTTDAPIRKPSNLEGLKIRVQQSPMAIEMVNQLGGQATPISWGELYTALQQGVVDGAENNVPSLYTTRHYELVDYYSLDQHTAPPDVLLMSTHTWEELSDQERGWLQEAVNASLQRQKKLWDQAQTEALEAVKEAGVEVIRPDKKPFMEKVQPLYDKIGQRQPQVYELLQRIRDVEVTDDS